MEWWQLAACARVDPDLFFPQNGDSGNHILEAKKVCRTCPVRISCLNYAIDNSERWGVWGGMTERERRRVKKERLNAV